MYQTASMYYIFRYALLSRLESEDKEQVAQRSAAAAVLRRLDKPEEEEEETNTAQNGRPRRPRKEDMVLNHYEQMIAMDVVAPEDIPVSFEGMACLFLQSACMPWADETLLCRYWRSGRHNRRAQRIRHLSFDNARILFELFFTTFGPYWCLALWASWLR